MYSQRKYYLWASFKFSTYQTIFQPKILIKSRNQMGFTWLHTDHCCERQFCKFYIFNPNKYNAYTLKIFFFFCLTESSINVYIYIYIYIYRHIFKNAFFNWFKTLTMNLYMSIYISNQIKNPLKTS